MNVELLAERLKQIAAEQLPLPGDGDTPARHARLMEIGREDLSVAKLAEAHWDAVSILKEAGRQPVWRALYAVWASEIPGKPLELEKIDSGFEISGTKLFCSGAGIVDRTLVTVGVPESRLIEIDLRKNAVNIEYDLSAWATDAFRITRTGAVTFRGVEVTEQDFVGDPDWYLNRPGFWHGACCPAACWAGGVEALVDFAMKNRRDDPHTLAHLGAMNANIWMMKACLDVAGREIDEDPLNRMAAQARALKLRHLVEEACTDTLSRFARAFGPQPLSMNADISRRYQEVELYLRQSHAERDLESLARLLRRSR
jgi:alkylation response protein AidB-like acyl-CoA dehydrogenase